MTRIIYFLLFLQLYFTFPSVSKELSQLNLEEKIGQLLIVHFNGNRSNEEARDLIEKAHVGGFIYYQWANELSSPDQIKTLSQQLQECSLKKIGIPLFIAIDQEGGVVTRLKNGFTVFPGNYALGMAGKPEFAERAAFAMGLEMKRVGINMNLAPVVDINSHPKNPIVGLRSFGEEKELVKQFGESALRGYLKAGLIPVLKHFPGFGDVVADPHEKLPKLDKTIDQLYEGGLSPFLFLSSQAPVIMTSHLLIPSLDSQCLTFSYPIVTNLLRKEMKYNGLIMTDSLVMKAILDDCPIEEAAIKSFEAGHDLLLLGGKQLLVTQQGFELTCSDILKIHQALVEAVKMGRLSEQKVDDSVQKILTLKNQLPHLFENEMMDESEIKKLNLEHQELAQHIATQSVKILRLSSTSSIPFRCQEALIIAPAQFQEEFQGISTDRCLFFNSLNLSFEEIDLIAKNAQNPETIIFCSYQAWKNPQQVELFNEINRLKKSVILMVLSHPQDERLFPEASLVVCTYSPTQLSILTGLKIIQGVIPSLSQEEALKIGKRIWNNECRGTVEGLTSWNEGEEFASMGIGHFIWYPENASCRFKQTFPDLILFLKEKGSDVPKWLLERSYCPWNSKEEFAKAQQDPRMISLRHFLTKHVDGQILFMINRLQKALPGIIQQLDDVQKAHVIEQFSRLASSSEGIYPLLDYLNFKGEGITEGECYQGKRWGLLQVLEGMHGKEAGFAAIEEFVNVAKQLLMQRIALSPPERNEQKWLNGWMNRLDTYKKLLN